MAPLTDIADVPAVTERPHGLLEAPRIAADGAILYSDVTGGGVWSCAADGTVGEVLPKRRGIGGMVPHADGGWVVSGRTLVHIAPDGSQREVFADEDAAGFNDLCVAPDGALLAGVLTFRPFAGEEPREGRLLRIGADGGVEVLSSSVLWPNGIGVSPGGDAVYISDYARRVVLRVDSGGAGEEPLCSVPEGSPDGLAVDAEGGVWVALGEAGAVARFTAEGALDEVVPMPASFVSSISFGGADMRDVLVTTADNRADPERGGTVLRARSEVPGLAVAPTTD